MPSRKNKKPQIVGKSQKGQAIPNLSEPDARAYFEKMLWPNGPVCPHCGSVDCYKMEGATIRPGLHRCRDCEKQFTVTVGTMLEDSHLPLSVWAKAFHLMATSKKGMSALQLQRNLGLGSYKTAWFLAHRLRLAMKCQPVSGLLQGQVQCDETLVGGKPRHGDGKRHGQGVHRKTPVLTLVETDGKARSQPIQNVDATTLGAAMRECIHPAAQIVSDEHPAYGPVGPDFAGGHETVNHTEKEYARKQVNEKGQVETITTNTAESYFSLLKRGVYGTFHHISKKHLHRYCAEFDFRWNGRTLNTRARFWKAQ